MLSLWRVDEHWPTSDQIQPATKEPLYFSIFTSAMESGIIGPQILLEVPSFLKPEAAQRRDKVWQLNLRFHK